MRLRGVESSETLEGRPHRLHGIGKKFGFNSRDRASARLVLLAAVVAACVASLLFLSPGWRGAPSVAVEAANPASGTIAPTGPVPTFTGNWVGTATGTGSGGGEATCVEGVNCD